ncbi:NAD-dependent epimerase/dehydratase family protein [Pelagibius marinus]|uniref:NAD-dependent epimerase/dehydratase family protein n=1 Tax=Pelagibius marinus TaxID=2762760 RepID=UPI001872C4C4|nr:NAD-dependent epimerase/dehydratase family protein [Pelagibius marinus]
MRLLVTGGCGFIGSRLVRILVSAGHEVVVLDDLSTGSALRLPAGVSLIPASVSMPNLSIASAGALDGIFHLAAISSVEAAEANPDDTHRVNVAGTRNILALAGARHPRPLPVVFASSAAVYGNGQCHLISEDHRKRPLGTYGATKLAAEQEAKRAFDEINVPSIGIRLFNVYGPWPPQGTPPPGVIASFCRQLAAGQQLVMHGSGKQCRDYLYLDDAAALLICAMETLLRDPTHAIVNGSTGKATSLLELAELLSALFPRPIEWQWEARRRADILNSVGDPAMAEMLLCCSPKVPLSEGLARTLGGILPSDLPLRVPNH